MKQNRKPRTYAEQVAKLSPADLISHQTIANTHNALMGVVERLTELTHDPRTNQHPGTILNELTKYLAAQLMTVEAESELFKISTGLNVICEQNNEP